MTEQLWNFNIVRFGKGRFILKDEIHTGMGEDAADVSKDALIWFCLPVSTLDGATYFQLCTVKSSSLKASPDSTRLTNKIRLWLYASRGNSRSNPP